MNNRVGRNEAARKIRQAVFNHYGLLCDCCGETQFEFLTIDHIDGGGTKERQTLNTQGEKLYRWLKKLGFPIGFRTLCYNCNCGRQRNNGVCPHKSK